MIPTTIAVDRTGLGKYDGMPIRVTDQAEIYVVSGAVQIFFTLPHGRGQSRFWVKADGKNFPALARAMMQAAPNEAIKAFGAALQAGIS
jgi:hypothetical protein